MKCIDCIEKKVKIPQEAEVYLINEYESIRPLCQECFDEYAYIDGEMNLDFYCIEIKGVGQERFIYRINEVLKYLNEMNARYSDRYFAAKRLGEKWVKTQPDPYADALSDLPEFVTGTRKHGKELLEAIKW